MNWFESREYEKKRRQIGKFGLAPAKTTGALAPFTAQILEHGRMQELYRKDMDVARGYASEQAAIEGYDTATFKQMFKKSPNKLPDNVKVTLLKTLDERIGVAHRFDKDLDELGQYIAHKTNAKWIHAKVKKLGGPTDDRGAYQKTVKDYIGDWSQNKDLMRGTVACQSQEQLLGVAGRIQIICSPEFGMTLVKLAERKWKTDPCGYSDWNFAVVMKGCLIPAEIQANTFAMMYAKMSKDDYTERILANNEAEYAQTESRMGFEGGLQHVFYEIWQLDKASPDGQLAAKLSTDYCDLARTPDSRRKTKAQQIGIKAQLDTFRSKLTNKKSQDVWDHRYDKH